MNKNLKEWKTTTLGVALLIAAGADYFHFHVGSELAVGVIALSGVGFLFAPDRILNILMKKAE